MIDPIGQKIESEEFFSEFEHAYMCLLDRDKSDAKKKVQSGELYQKSMYKHITENKPSSGDVYSNICTSGCLIQFPESMKLFKFSLLIPPSTSGVERGFSAMNLIVTPPGTNLNQANINRFMHISMNGPEKNPYLGTFHAVPCFKVLFPITLYYTEKINKKQEKTNKNYIHGNNIVGLFDALPIFPFTTSETKRDY